MLLAFFFCPRVMYPIVSYSCVRVALRARHQRYGWSGRLALVGAFLFFCGARALHTCVFTATFTVLARAPSTFHLTSRHRRCPRRRSCTGTAGASSFGILGTRTHCVVRTALLGALLVPCHPTSDRPKRWDCRYLSSMRRCCCWPRRASQRSSTSAACIPNLLPVSMRSQ